MNEPVFLIGADRVGAIGQGTASDFTAGGRRDRECEDLLRHGLDLGMNFIDTAPAYEDGHAEEIVGRAIRGRRADAFVATKFSARDAAPAAVVRSAEASLRRLGTDRIDLLQIHWPSVDVPLAETLGAMVELVREGKVRYIGLGNSDPREISEAICLLPHGLLVSTQQEFSLAERSIETSLLPTCHATELALIAYSPLNRGRLASDPRRDLLKAIGKRHDATPEMIALAWLRSKPGVLPIPKAARLTHLEACARAASIELRPGEIACLEDAFRPMLLPVPTEEIELASSEQHPTYTNLHDAIENPLGIRPGPTELAERLRAGELLKPVRVRPIDGDPTRRARYALLEGRVRYWAWVIAHRGREPIPAIVEASPATPRGAAPNSGNDNERKAS